jgi:hypothetical protein
MVSANKVSENCEGVCRVSINRLSFSICENSVEVEIERIININRLNIFMDIPLKVNIFYPYLETHN